MVDLGYLAGEWGGEVLTLRICDEEGNWVGGADVRIGHGVKFRGRHITPETWDQKNEMIRPQPQAGQAAQASLGDILTGVMEVIARSRQDDLAMIRDMIAATATASAPAAPVASTAIDPIKQLEGLASTYERLHSLFGGGASDGGEVGGGGGSDELFKTINNVTSVISKLSAKKESAEQQPKPRLQGQRPPAGVRIPAPPMQHEAVGPVISPDMMVKYLSGLSPTDAADIVADSLAEMPDGKREATIKEFLESYGAEEDTSSEELETESSGEDERTEASRTI